jgi:pilus assembly protein CpaE
MLDLPAVLIGIADRVLPGLRRELANNGVEITGEHASLNALAGRGLDEGVHLFVCLLASNADLEGLQKLSGTYVGQPILVFLVEKADPGLVFKAMRAGATQVVPLPLPPQDFKEALNCIALQFNQARASSRVIAFTGASGGCGVTSVALNAAYEIAFWQKRTAILLECAQQMGMAQTYLDLQPKYTVRDLLRFGQSLDSHAVRKSLTRVADRFDVIVGPPGVPAKASSSDGDVRDIIHYARFLCDFVVLDVPPTLDERYFDILSNASQVVVLFEQKIPSVRNLQLILDVLPPAVVASRCQLMINRYEPRLTGFTAAELGRVLKKPGIKTIANDPTMDAAVNNGRPLRLQNAGCAALADINRLSHILAGGEPCQAEPTASFVGKIMRGLHLA